MKRALCSVAALPDNRATCAVVLLPDASGAAPEWVQLLPAGAEVVGRDGRRWVNDRPADVVAAFNSAEPLPVDEEHATDLAAPEGQPAPAAAWIEELQLRADGSIWGRTAWNSRGKDLVGNRAYRWLSPVFDFEKATGRILRLAGAALTNRPNLRLTALNREEGSVMDRKRLCQSLGLSETATDDEVCAAIATARNRVTSLETDLATARNTPDPTKFIPKAQHDAVVERATNAERKLKDIEAAGREQEITTAIDDASKAGKIVPATVEYYRAMCRTEGGLEKFREFVKTAPVIGDGTALNHRKPPDGGTADAAAVELGKVFGNSAEDLKKYGGR